MSNGQHGAAGWAAYCLSQSDRCYPNSTNVGMAVTGWQGRYNGRIIMNEGTKKMEGKTYYVKGFTLNDGSKPDVTKSEFERHCRMATGDNCNYDAGTVKLNIASIGQYKNTRISVFKLGSSHCGSMRVGKNWQYCIIKHGDTWYHCIAH